MPYAECSNETCSTCACPACGGRGDLCSCSQAEFNQARAQQTSRAIAITWPHEHWSPAHDYLYQDSNTRLATASRYVPSDTDMAPWY